MDLKEITIAILAFFGTGGGGYALLRTWAGREREAGRAEEYRKQSEITIEDLRSRLSRAESFTRCQTCPLWDRREPG